MVQFFVSLNQNKTQTCHPKNFEAKDRVADSEFFCWVSTRICVRTCLDECILGVLFVDVFYFYFFWLLHEQHFWKLVSEMVFKISLAFWIDWAPFLENRLLVSFVHFLINLQYEEDFKTSLQAPLFEKQKECQTNQRHNKRSFFL